jgi:hypothetical protein
MIDAFGRGAACARHWQCRTSRIASTRPATARNGIPLLRRPDSQALVTLEILNALRDELP